MAHAVLTLLLGTLPLITSASAHAGLGEPETTIEDDRHALSGVMRTAPELHPAYRVYLITTTGRTIREYVANNGTIFGIAWQGINHPDLQPLMGTYYSEFKETAKRTGRTRVRLSHGSIRSAHVVVETSGHLREMHGRAFVQSLLPEGVTANEIR